MEVLGGYRLVGGYEKSFIILHKQKKTEYIYSTIHDVNSVEYYYIRNAQGSIIALIGNSGTQVVSYVYDRWDKLIGIKDDAGRDITDDTASVDTRTIIGIGYRYDNVAQLYYCATRP